MALARAAWGRGKLSPAVPSKGLAIHLPGDRDDPALEVSHPKGVVVRGGALKMDCGPTRLTPGLLRVWGTEALPPAQLLLNPTAKGSSKPLSKKQIPGLRPLSRCTGACTSCL